MIRDISVTGHGTIILVALRTPAAEAWVANNVGSEAQFWGGALVVEPRYLEDLLVGMRNDGLVGA